MKAEGETHATFSLELASTPGLFVTRDASGKEPVRVQSVGGGDDVKIASSFWSQPLLGPLP